MWITASLRQRSGALAPAAESFLDGWLGQDAPQYRGGRDGLVALCKQLEHFMYRRDVDEESERRFVEGAGALLGVLLIDYIGDASHAAEGNVHRVRLGESGFFDPFAAVDRALDAPCIRSELAREIELAEAEARSAGPISRVVSSLRSLLASERPDFEIEEQFECKLRLRHRTLDDTLELDLKRAVDSTRDQGRHAVDNIARRLLSLLPGAPDSELELADVKVRMLPRLQRADAVRDLSAQGQSVLLTRPLSDELVVALLVEYQGRARYVRTREVEGWGMAVDETFALAMENLRARSERARIVREPVDDGATFIARTGDGRDSARVLLPELYAELAERVGPDLCVAVPHRDTFFVCDGSKPTLVQHLAQRAAEDAARAPHALSARVHRLTAQGLR